MANNAQKFLSKTRPLPLGTPSERLWSIDWQQSFTGELCASVIVKYLRFGEAYPLFQPILASVFKDTKAQGPSKSESTIKRRQAHYESISDCFLFYHDLDRKRPIGYAVCELHDYETYYIRHVGIAESEQSRGVYRAFFEKLSEVLASASVNRIEGDVSFSNARHVKILAKMGYQLSGQTYSKEFGGMNRFVYFLDRSDALRFAEMFPEIAGDNLAEDAAKWKRGSAA